MIDEPRHREHVAHEGRHADEGKTALPRHAALGAAICASRKSAVTEIACRAGEK